MLQPLRLCTDDDQNEDSSKREKPDRVVPLQTCHSLQATVRKEDRRQSCTQGTLWPAETPVTTQSNI